AGGTGSIPGPPPHAAHRPLWAHVRDVTFPAAPRELGSVGPTLAAGWPRARRGAAGRGRTRRCTRTAREGLPSAAWPWPTPALPGAPRQPRAAPGRHCARLSRARRVAISGGIV